MVNSPIILTPNGFDISLSYGNMIASLQIKR